MDAGDNPDDVVELGRELGGGRLRLPGGWRPSRGAAVFAVAALAVGLAVGYLAGGHSCTARFPGFPDLASVPYSGCKCGPDRHQSGHCSLSR